VTGQDGEILRPPPKDGAAWNCSQGVEKPKPIFFAECGKPAVCVIIGKGARCAEHDPER
jgi:hypothetical protein